MHSPAQNYSQLARLVIAIAYSKLSTEGKCLIHLLTL